jgi:hypothetical protein
MHTRHEELFRWLLRIIPTSKLYGPYYHGGRNYFQWMARGKTLRDDLLPILFRRFYIMDAHIRHRIEEMVTRYRMAEKVDGAWRLLESPDVRPNRARRES